MRKWSIASALVAVMLLLGSVSGQQQPAPDTFVAGELLVKFNPGMNAAQRNNILSGRRAARIRRFASLDTEAREPAQRRALEPLWFRAPNGDADLERVSEVDARELDGGVADQGEVAGLEGPSETGLCRPLACHRTYVRMGATSPPPRPGLARTFASSTGVGGEVRGNVGHY